MGNIVRRRQVGPAPNEAENGRIIRHRNHRLLPTIHFARRNFIGEFALQQAAVNQVPENETPWYRFRNGRAQELMLNAKTEADSQLQQLEAGIPPNMNLAIENLVFSGGGSKGAAFAGVLMALEDLNIQARRFAGTSIGALVATLLAVGCSSGEVAAVLYYDIWNKLKDTKCCWVIDILALGGMHSGYDFHDMLDEVLYNKTGIHGITFLQIYEQYQIELCIVASNVSTGREEYFHPKTTPDLCVAEAVRASISIPGIMKPMARRRPSGPVDLYVDGAVLCNYPLHVFDGNYLLMEDGHDLNAHVIPTIIPRVTFSEFNRRTLGFTFTSPNIPTREVGPAAARLNSDLIRPNTKLCRSRLRTLDRLANVLRRRNARDGNLRRFLRIVRRRSRQHDGAISIQTLVRRIENQTIPEDLIESLFRRNRDEFLGLVSQLPVDTAGYISQLEFTLFLVRLGINFAVESDFVNHAEDDRPGLLNMLINVIYVMNERANQLLERPEDHSRTVLINTDYIEAFDDNLEDDDICFVIKQGYKAFKAYLHEFHNQNPFP